LLSVVVELDRQGEDGSEYSSLTVDAPRETIRAARRSYGLWTAFRTRPFSKVPQSDSAPRSIFITAIDTRPLAADPGVVVAAEYDAFEVGLNIVGRLTEGPVFLCTGPGWNGPTGESDKVRHVSFTGPHPAGLPGTHIHHLDPVSAQRSVWHIGYQDIIAIGKLLAEGRISVERVVALGGAGLEQPRLVKTRLGANLNDLTAGELKLADGAGRMPRLISGSVLSGRTGIGAEAFLGRYHVQVSAIPEGGERELFGWSGVFSRAFSFSGLLKRRQGHKTLRPLSTARNGRPTAMVPVDAFEHIIPLDILPVPLLRALLIRDTDQAQALGCLELDAEDLALCSFVCPGKNDYGDALRRNLDQIEREG
jgi:Na+-transporting NADH:ubiquinone oxidoreductase subunit A